MSGPCAASGAALSAQEVAVAAGARRLLDGVSLDAVPGEVVGLVGPNGSGKSTLLRTVYRALRPERGRVLVNGREVAATPVREVARTVAAVVQEPAGDLELTVREVVAMGRAPHQRTFGPETAHDRRVVADALERVAAADLAERPFASLSGGERQRVLIARALAQEPALLVLDEPGNHLDVRHQLALLTLLRRLPATSLVALHDLNLAARFCDRLCLLRAGKVTASGPPRQVLNAALLSEVYGARAEVAENPATGAPQVTFHLPEADGEHKASVRGRP
ncbi:ABC transporter ATP-binding protein [Streptomyces sp. DSM 44917]|uniref:ABC transporter ATP-binding protein n=1 Tax=Streptomyces boetiae TaxID=3075541 RepID=A0ABU2LBB2_9ACTN|nr:ABC transporter ATP-binding protein [Streptomyces sp. DSM 44917]MDT0308844.1 ABC transporter ATP-binding protein [Streptomyces sp. DSM 44917]